MHRPPGDQGARDRAEAEEPFEVVGDAVVLPVQGDDLGEVDQVFGDGHGLRPGAQGVRGLVRDRQLDVTADVGQSQAGVERLDRLRAEP